MKKNCECSSVRFNLDLGENPHVPASAAWPCATILRGYQPMPTSANLPPVPPKGGSGMPVSPPGRRFRRRSSCPD